MTLHPTTTTDPATLHVTRSAIDALTMLNMRVVLDSFASGRIDANRLGEVMRDAVRDACQGFDQATIDALGNTARLLADALAATRVAADTKAAA